MLFRLRHRSTLSLPSSRCFCSRSCVHVGNCCHARAMMDARRQNNCALVWRGRLVHIISLRVASAPRYSHQGQITLHAAATDHLLSILSSSRLVSQCDGVCGGYRHEVLPRPPKGSSMASPKSSAPKTSDPLPTRRVECGRWSSRLIIVRLLANSRARRASHALFLTFLAVPACFRA